MTGTSSAKVTSLTATRSFKTPAQWIPPKTYGRKEEVSYFQLLSSPTVYTCAPPSLIVSASHVPSSSAIPLVDIPHIIDPPSGSPETCVRALTHDGGTVQTVMQVLERMEI